MRPRRSGRSHARVPNPSRSSEPPRARGLPVLVLAFILSGAAGLIYESIWSRYLGLLVGHAAYAQVLVLVIFMGGMAVGALAVGKVTERLTNPLFLYAAVEAIVGVLGAVFHPAFEWATSLAYERWFPALGGMGAVATAKWCLAGLLILPQSVLLGATFPLMSAGVVRRVPQRPGRVIALLYFANSIGAAAGVLAGGFWLVRIVGLPGTVGAAALLNFIVAGMVIALLRLRSAAPAGEQAPAAQTRRPPETSPAVGGGIPALLIAVSFGTALASFVYEIAWVRMLSLVLGSSTHSFELMLSAFILGLALGSWWIRARADGVADPLRALGAAQWVMGALALATLPLYAASFGWMGRLITAWHGWPACYPVFAFARYGIGLAVMLPATFCAGVTLPLITRTLMIRGFGEQAIGIVYGVNTLGSILGAALAGLVLLPWLGVKGLLAAGASLDMGLGVALLATAGASSGRRAPGSPASVAGGAWNGRARGAGAP